MSLPKTAILDLSAALPLSTVDLAIRFPGSSTPTGWVITLAGPAHPATVALATELGRDVIDQENAVLLAQANGRKFKLDDEPVELRRRKNVGKVCRRILSWAPSPTFKSVSPDPIEFSHAAATDLFLRPDMGGFFVQVTDYLNGERAFMPPSEKL